MCEDCVIAQLDGRHEKRGVEAVTTDFELEHQRDTRPAPPGVIRCPICSQVKLFISKMHNFIVDFYRRAMLGMMFGKH